MSKDRLTYMTLLGREALPWIPALAGLRIRVFRDFPYLYDGDPDYEEDYLRTFAGAPGSILVAALDGEQVVGASTGMPLAQETENIRGPWAAMGADVSRIFYYGESVLLKPYRGQGAGLEFFRRREAHARRLDGFERLCFCAVLRPSDHPLRPADYVPLDGFWRKRGFRPVEGLTCRIPWKDLGEREETPKPLQFWQKFLKEPGA